MARYTSMAYQSADEMVFGTAKYPVKYGRDFEVGGGLVYPELVPHPRPGSEETKKSLVREYEKMVNDVLERCVQLGFPGIQVELEHVYQMTRNPDWGGEIAAATKRLMDDYYQKYGLKSAIRATIADYRKPDEENMRDSDALKNILATFEASAAAGADNLSIESMGGKEITDYAIVRQDIRGVLFGIGVLGSRDVEFLWKKIVEIANKYGVTPGGDTDCSQANVAMFMAGGYLDKSVPHTFAAICRAIAAARTLVAYEQGAKGPTKDCGYEDPIIKAIAGIPISMEGKTCACAHSDLLGNLVAAVCDLWSNEAVEYHDMFGGTTAAVFTEILGYDVALMNTAIKMGKAKDLRDMMINSDKYRDTHGFILSPDNAYEIGKAIVSNAESYYSRARAAAIKAAELMRGDSKLLLSDFEKEVLESTYKALLSLPDKEEDFIAECIPVYQKQVKGFKPSNYGL
ncbi:methanol:cobalamin methyltransferase, subunit B [Desulfofundulus kuznetsovii DSM 6115]|uniref:Methanol:cobalamin methyltransferase, subunit B n=1 Tax=Desulfofundulus kuznetsovii (strain DSM 6115 / VKM B-1805 / 17) TaxID=760568 RepID=A0AAU8PA80_DESK7|nr:methanol:cobalamin methyltransferase, subunit B [Desulfofundulus kuznetsovii DSM 6115]MCL6557668.1 methanol--corrinoid methyltransferase [Bacillota bacterium]